VTLEKKLCVLRVLCGCFSSQMQRDSKITIQRDSKYADTA